MNESTGRVVRRERRSGDRSITGVQETRKQSHGIREKDVVVMRETFKMA